jgi:hypothetical protein
MFYWLCSFVVEPGLGKSRAVAPQSLFEVHNMCTAVGGASPALFTAGHCCRQQSP